MNFDDIIFSVSSSNGEKLVSLLDSDEGKYNSFDFK